MEIITAPTIPPLGLPTSEFRERKKERSRWRPPTRRSPPRKKRKIRSGEVRVPRGGELRLGGRHRERKKDRSEVASSEFREVATSDSEVATEKERQI
jgi:hypothetical protein